MNPIFKEYAWSAFITFMVAFTAALAPAIGHAPVDSAALFALFAAALRAGGAAVLNLAYTFIRSFFSPKEVTISSK